MQGQYQRFKNVKLLICDFDGVMTNDTVIVDQSGKESVICSRCDGLGIEMLKKTGIEILVISKEKNPVVIARCRKLNIKVINGIDDKINILKKEIKNRNIVLDDICYIGNYVNDIDCIKAAGIGVAVADAHPSALDIADYITKKKGGKGAVREICDIILNQ